MLDSINNNFDGLLLDCSITIANALEIPQSCYKLSIYCYGISGGSLLCIHNQNRSYKQALNTKIIIKDKPSLPQQLQLILWQCYGKNSISQTMCQLWIPSADRLAGYTEAHFILINTHPCNLSQTWQSARHHCWSCQVTCGGVSERHGWLHHKSRSRSHLWYLLIRGINLIITEIMAWISNYIHVKGWCDYFCIITMGFTYLR